MRPDVFEGRVDVAVCSSSILLGPRDAGGAAVLILSNVQGLYRLG